MTAYPCLRDDLVLVEQTYRGEQTYILKDPVSHKYFRFKPLEIMVMQTLDGERVEIEATGLLARALQHEIDHLNGILFIDRMNSAAKASLSSKLKRLQKETQRGLTTSRHLRAVEPAL